MDMRSVNSSLLSIGRWLRRGADAVGRQVFPPICLGCGALVGTHGGVCADCWRGLRFVEKPLCDVLGTPFAHDMGDGLLSAEAIADPPPFRRVRSAVQYDALARAMVHRLKYNDRTDLAPVMARWMARAGGRSTFPQIFIGKTHVGGCDELHALEHRGKLDDLLRSAA